MASGLEALDSQIAVDCPNFALALLPAAAKNHLEDLLATKTFTYSSPFTEKYVDQGRAEGEAKGRAEGRAAEAAEAVLRVLAARGIVVPDDIRDRVTSCTDHDQLTAWLTRAVHVDTAEDLFG